MTVPEAENRTSVPSARRGAEADRGGLPAGVGHLRRDRALPDQLVEPELVARQLLGHLRGRPEVVTGGPDGLVGLLGALRLAGVHAGRVGDVLGAVQLRGLPARGVDRLRAQRRGVGTHVGDVAVLVQALRGAHGLPGRHPQLARRLLLEGRRGERRGRAARVRLGLERGDGERGVGQRRDQGRGPRLVEVRDVGGAQLPGVQEVAAGGHAAAVDRRQARVEGRLGVVRDGERAGHVPVVGGDERHALTLALDHQPRRDGLHAAGRQALADLAPQHRADLVPVQPVEDAPRLLGVDQPVVQLAGVGQRPLDGLGGDLVEHHALDGDLGLELLQQVPGDGLALAVLIGGQEELVGVLQQLLELADLLLLVGVDHVVRGEAVVDVHGELAERALLHVRGQLRGLREVTDVPDARLDVVPLAEVPGDRARLGRRLHDHELAPCRHRSGPSQTSTGRSTRATLGTLRRPVNPAAIAMLRPGAAAA